MNVRDRLPDLRHYRREVSKREPVLRDIGLARLEISERRRTLSEFERVFESAMAQTQNVEFTNDQLETLLPYLRKLDEMGDMEQLIAEMQAFDLPMAT